jgi:Protein of unknown function (DUF4058)
MPRPFPGVDPYIEAQGGWRDFRVRFLVYCRDLIVEGLPESYVALLDEKVHRVRIPYRSALPFWAEIPVAQEPSSASGRLGRTAGVATIEPITIPLETDILEEVRESWIEIRRLPDMSLVTVVELLSPSNKVGNGREEYLERRLALIRQPVHIVELDFLLGGHRLPMRNPLPPGHAYAIVSRAERRPDAEVYAWTLRDGLPPIPIPLDAPDPDVSLELAPAFGMAYDRGRYGRILRYHEPLPFPVDPEDRLWIEALGREVGHP